MRCFLKGVFLGILAIIMFGYGLAEYSHHVARKETQAWLDRISPIQAEISTKALKAGALSGAGLGINGAAFTAQGLQLFKIDEDGNIFIKGGRESQMIVLQPKLVDKQIVWICIGGSNVSVPASCRQD